MTQHSELLAAFDAAWEHPWESLSSALDGLSEEEASFQHPAYAEVPREEGYPPSGTILWHIAHLTFCYRRYKAGIEERPADPKGIEPLPVATLTEAIAHLKQARDELRQTFATLPEESLDDKLHYDIRVIDLARSTVRHDAWHAGQIAVARRLYRMRERGSLMHPVRTSDQEAAMRERRSIEMENGMSN